MTAHVMLVIISQPTTLWYQRFFLLSLLRRKISSKTYGTMGISQQDTVQFLSLEKCPYLFLLLKSEVTVQLFPLVTIWIVLFVIIENSILTTLSPQSLLYSIHITFNFGSICQTMLTESTCYGAIFFVWNVFYSPFPFPGKKWIRSIVFSYN